MTHTTSIGEVIASADAGIEHLDTGIAAGTAVEEALEQAPPIVATAQEQAEAIVEVLNRLGEMQGLLGAAATAAAEYREGGMQITKTFRNAVHEDNVSVGSAAYALWQSKGISDLRRFSSGLQSNVESAIQAANSLVYNLGQVAAKLQQGSSSNAYLKERAQALRTATDTQARRI